MAKNKIVHVLTSKSFRIVIHCPKCPVSRDNIESNQKTACVHFRKPGNRAQRRNGGGCGVGLVRIQECEWYEKDSLKKMDNGINTILCNYY